MTYSIEDLVKKLCYESNYYIDENAILEEIKTSHNVSEEMINKLIDKFSYALKNKCVDCGIDMGINNPRQLCRKTYCDNKF